ncbi:MAG: hypothetical protein ACTS5I_11590 [Rhodanobacter sp.]
MHRLLCLVGFVFSVATLHAQEQAVTKPDGTRITTRQVPLLAGVPASCIALETRSGKATVVLSKEDLDRLAARDERAVESDISRMELLASGRARDLLKSLSSQRDSRGCQRVIGALPFDTNYLVGWLLEQGKAAVYMPQRNLPEPVIVVRRIDSQLSGYEIFSLLDGTEVWSYSVWVS